MGDPRPLTTEQAREHAKRWAEWHAWAQRRKAARDYDAEYEGPWDPHGEEGSERERLESWVLKQMSDWGDNGTTAFRKLRSRLGLTDAQTDALLRAAGGPS